MSLTVSFWTNYTSAPAVLTSLSYAFGVAPYHINHSGQIVGQAIISNYIRTALFPERRHPLDKRVQSAAGLEHGHSHQFRLGSGTGRHGINDSGVIVGAGANHQCQRAIRRYNVLHAFALVPVITKPPARI